jgi:hypothetical protein
MIPDKATLYKWGRRFLTTPPSVWTMIAMVIAVVALLGALKRADAAADRAARAERQVIVQRAEAAGQRAGRAIALQAICGFGNGVAEAGQVTIAGGMIQPPKFRRNLERLGLPSEKVRARAARMSADRYARRIRRSVVRATGIVGLVRDDGTLNCAALRSAARATPTTP